MWDQLLIELYEISENTPIDDGYTEAMAAFVASIQYAHAQLGKPDKAKAANQIQSMITAPSTADALAEESIYAKALQEQWGKLLKEFKETKLSANFFGDEGCD